MYVLSCFNHISSTKMTTATSYTPAFATSSAPAQPQPTTPVSDAPYVSPALSSKVAIASQSNPILANLLKAVLNRTATDDQVKTLGLLIQSLEGVPELESFGGTPPAALTPHASTPVREGSPKPFDIILEFHEHSTERWIFPRGDVYCERVGVVEGTSAWLSDVIVTTCIPFLNHTGTEPRPSDPSTDAPTPEVVSFRFSKVHLTLWELLLGWAGGPAKMEESKEKLVDAVGQFVPICT